jgi:hypothetical protein
VGVLLSYAAGGTGRVQYAQRGKLRRGCSACGRFAGAIVGILQGAGQGKAVQHALRTPIEEGDMDLPLRIEDDLELGRKGRTVEIGSNRP